MTEIVHPIGSAARPARVAVIGAGPAGFFTAEALLRSEAPHFEVDLIERLPTPFGLVRAGVAPDHQKIKTVTKTFDRTASHQRFRFLGNVEVGSDVTHEELRARYDQVVYAVGSSADRRLGIPGEELTGCHAATAFVGWYNTHPDFRDFPFDLRGRRAVVVGVGNVALDVARVLLRSRAELARTDIHGKALEQLQASGLREVVLLARRGPAQAAFTPGELKDIAELEGVSVELDLPLLEREAAPGRMEGLDAAARKNLEQMLAIARAPRRPAERTLKMVFCASPVEVLGDDSGCVRGVRVEENELIDAPGGPKARGTGRFFDVEASLVFRSVGYLGVPVPGVPFDDQGGIIPNDEGRVLVARGGARLPHTYAVGWIRRGPLGVIGTNKADGVAVAARMIEDVGGLPARDLPPRESAQGIDGLLAGRGRRVTSYADWRVIDAHEVAVGRDLGKVRDKVASVDEMMNHLLRTSPRPAAG